MWPLNTLLGYKLGYNKKNEKGEISIINHRGRILLRWRHEGERYPLSLPYDYTPENMHHAKIKMAEIELDILKGCFDTTLKKNKPTNQLSPNEQSINYVLLTLGSN